jgi:FKBP-type peptidyl-prolyl cis-trans isomerase
VRRIAALLLIPALLLPAACGGGSANVAATAAPTPGASITSGAAYGEEPKIKTFGNPPKETDFKVLKEGSGKVVKSGDILVANFKGQVWDQGGIDLIPFENSFESKSPMVRPIGSGGIIAAWDKKVPGQKVGSRLLLTAPPDQALGSTGNQVAGILPNDTLVFVIDILDSFSPKEGASGKEVTAGLAGLPTVKGATTPTITIPKNGTPSKTLVSKVLIEGKGDVVKDAQFMAVHYTGVLWRNGKTFDSSWERPGGPVPIGITLGEGIIEGWSKGLVGKKVGSRVLLVVPPADGYGKDGLKVAGITATDTLVFVVDIIRAF